MQAIGHVGVPRGMEAVGAAEESFDPISEPPTGECELETVEWKSAAAAPRGALEIRPAESRGAARVTVYGNRVTLPARGAFSSTPKAGSRVGVSNAGWEKASPGTSIAKTHHTAADRGEIFLRERMAESPAR
jgi:hypothetical protein